MDEKYLNFLLFLIEEEQKNAKKIRREFLDRGIDLEKEKQMLLEKLSKIKAEIRKQKAREFKDKFNSSLSLLKDKLFVDEYLNKYDVKLAYGFRRNKDRKMPKLKEEDINKLKLIQFISENNKAGDSHD